MTDLEFAALTQDEQIQRIEVLGRKALAEFGIVPLTIEPLVHAENTTYRIVSDPGEFCLRVCRPGYQSDANVASEIAFVGDLRRAGFDVPRPFGDRVVKAEVPEVPQARNCVLLGWQNGEVAKTGFSPEQAFAVGSAMARLHAFSLTWSPPVGFDRQDLHAWRLKPMVLEAPQPLVGDDDLGLLREIIDESRRRLAEMPREADSYGVIHGDLHRGNVLFEGETVKIIDFDDAGWGFLVADLAAALAYEMRFPIYAEVQAAMLKGYETIRPLPPGAREALPAFLRMRFMYVVNWVLQRTDNPHLRETAPAWIEGLCQAIRQTG